MGFKKEKRDKAAKAALLNEGAHARARVYVLLRRFVPS